jgi:hypothetical protein
MPRTTMKYFGCGLWGVLVHEDEERRLEVRDMATFRAALGDEIVASLTRLMFAVDRLHSMHTLGALNDFSTLTSDETKKWNNVAIICIAWGYLHEAARALDELEKAQVVDLLMHPAAWDLLGEVRQRWFGAGRDPLAKTLRNALAFHPGDLSAVRSAVAAWPNAEVAVLMRSRGEMAREGHWPFGLEAILRAEGIDEARLSAFIADTIGPQFDLQEKVFDLIVALARSNDGKRRP